MLAQLGGLTAGEAISPDGSSIVGEGADGVARIYPCDECESIGHVFALARALLALRHAGH
jgi:hypothetical protein